MGGARFVLFQIVSWTCFGAGAALQVLYLLSLVVVELELFVGAMAVAGSLFVVAEIGMMMSLLVFRKSTQSKSEHESVKEDSACTTARNTPSSLPLSFHERLCNFADECLGVMVVGGLANIYVVPNIMMFSLFALTSNLNSYGVVQYGFLAWGVEAAMMMSRSIATHPEKVKAVMNVQRPRDVHEIRSFLGLTSYFCRYIPGYALISAPLEGLKVKDEPFLWSISCTSRGLCTFITAFTFSGLGKRPEGVTI
ncbi:unnamed protein product [Phytophthora lilii]|uniref:Unnamed protein product n=1 Tax=Phytophthora lilii TaxID=2077276 RepID=A0A9W6Y148_9STRA|nr:unnamed protein product [Phytophthora lilii]